MNNKKILLTSFVVFTFGMYSVVKQFNNNSGSISITPTPTVSLSPTTSSGPSTTLSPSQTANNKYKDGQYTGASTDAFYGNVQVKVTIKNGELTNVQFLDYPKDRGHSIEISNQAMPILSSEAIKAQNANVDIVSGATQTSQAFIQSLQSALTQAQS